jgi:AhpD family alkylhydroperoxidase
VEDHLLIAKERAKVARMSGASERSVSPEVRAVFERVQTKFGTVLEPISLTAIHPEIFKAYMDYEASFRAASRLELKLKELAFLKVAALIGCPFCLDFGSAEAKRAGITEEQMRDLPRYSQSLAFTDAEKLILDLATAMTDNPVKVSESLFLQLQHLFDPAQILEITAAIAWENYRSRFNHALGIEARGFSAGSYCVIPEVHP